MDRYALFISLISRMRAKTCCRTTPWFVAKSSGPNKLALLHAFCSVDQGSPALPSRDVHFVATAMALAYLGAQEQIVKAVARAVLWWS